MMSTQKRQVLIRVQPTTYEKLKIIADRNHRSVTNQLEYLMLQFIADYESTNGQIPLVSGNAQSNVVQNNWGGLNNFAVNGNVYNGK